MDSAVVVLALIALLAHVGDVAASCREVPNDDMLEYLCEGGQPGDLATVPEDTEKLRISRMPLRRITADTFAKFGSNLWVLSCSHCEIGDIETDAFRRLINLQQLSLDNNYLTAVKASWFEGLDSLTYLDVNYNDIRDIEDGVYQNLPALVDFRISGNRLQCLNLDGMSHLRQLKRMFLSENPEFACPHAVSEFLENQRVTFERDPEWRRLDHDAVEVHVPPAHVEEEEKDSDKANVPAYQERPAERPPQQPEAPIVPSMTGDRSFHSAEHYGRHRRPTTTSTTMRPIILQSHIPRVEPIPPPRTSYQVPPDQSSRPVIIYPYPTPETPRAPLQESKSPLENAKMTAGADGPPLTEDVSIYPSYIPTYKTPLSHTTYEKPQASSGMSGPTSEEMRFMAGAHRFPSAEHTSTYVPTHGMTSTYPAYVPTHGMTSTYPSYTTPEGSRVPLVESRVPSEFTTGSAARPDKPTLTEHTLTHPPYEPTRETMSYPYPYATSERSRVSVAAESEASAEKEVTTWSGGQSRTAEETVTYPLYTATSDGLERTPHDSIEMTRSWSTGGSDAFTSRTWSTDDSSQEDGERREGQPSSWPTNVPMGHQETPYHVSHEPTGHGYTSNGEVPVDDRWSSSSTGDFIATDLPVETGRSRITVMTSASHEDQDQEDLHAVRPLHPASQPELMHPVSADDFYQAPYYESAVTMHTPLLNYREEHDDEEMNTVLETTTDKPEPECPPKSSAPRVRPVSVLVMSIVVVIFGHVIVAGF